MADVEKPRRRRRNGFMEGPDQVLRLQHLYRSQVFSGERVVGAARQTHAHLDSVSSPDPGEDLDDSEISDFERRQAIARERMRREGRL